MPVGVQHLGVAGVDRHARADGRLRQVNRRDVATLQVSQGHWQFRFEGRNELAAGGHRGVRRALAADQDDAGGEGVGARYRSIIRPSASVRIGQVPVTEKPASITASRKVSQPVLEVPSSPFFSDCLKA